MKKILLSFIIIFSLAATTLAMAATAEDAITAGPAAVPATQMAVNKVQAMAELKTPPGPPAPQQSQDFSPKQVNSIQKIVHDYLLQNPQVMVDVFQKLQQEQQVMMEKHAVDAIHKNATQLFYSSDSPVVGNKNGTVTLVEFFDYQCPHCKEMTAVVEEMLKQDKNLRVVMKEFPIFPGSMYASQAALAAAKQGKYWKFHNALMNDKNPLHKKDVLTSAKEAGLNIKELEKDMKSQAIKDELKNNLILAQKIGLVGTPAFIIQSKANKDKTFFVPGQVSAIALQQLIQQAS